VHCSPQRTQTPLSLALKHCTFSPLLLQIWLLHFDLIFGGVIVFESFRMKKTYDLIAIIVSSELFSFLGTKKWLIPNFMEKISSLAGQEV